ncbi:MAG: acetyl-CoA decarbonylase/synthase complex subunit gamma [Methanomassiliicoccales archaeon]|jgi:acetyl-CoA decarbonylase/synthase complex subunit gamma|nr:acetyl-CoA decarbonylase/synthase complex subunit gamma [Methanomassiliicoccales archaeon]MDD1756456.1 acetyl-CoA decarbonylase/synthase complex subunit gamma [Methanomassiliicoccales archaeon]
MPTAIEIFKHLPKKNCGKCNYPTCLAFAMQLANSKAKLEDCPFVSEEGKAALAASSAPPIRLVRFGSGQRAIEMGDETEIYRHEKKFFHPTAFAVAVSDQLPKDEVRGRVEAIRSVRFERVGQTLGFDSIAVKDDSGDPSKFASAVEEAASACDLPLVLVSSSPERMKVAASKVAARRPLLYGADQRNLAEMASVARTLGCPMALTGAKDLNEMADLAAKAKATGLEDLVLDLGSKSLKDQLEGCSKVRKLSVKKLFRGLGYPILVDAGKGEEAVLKGMLAVMKYGSLVIFDDISEAQALPLFVLRQNIYTDPQVPIQVKPGLYPVNGAKEGAPILFTTNFSLTYFTVLADIEKSKVPAWLLVVDSEGLSVMTAFSAGKLTPEIVVKALESSAAKERSGSEVLVMPGMVSRMSGKLQELSGMRVVVGPKESSGIPKFLKNLS